ncbi:MAG: hypothetical protein HY303_08125 [Candidatus Wallbacteria bacterium]|nr:hypothetical protein [Candidatus Wallbacteria bacterium]
MALDWAGDRLVDFGDGTLRAARWVNGKLVYVGDALGGAAVDSYYWVVRRFDGLPNCQDFVDLSPVDGSDTIGNLQPVVLIHGIQPFENLSDPCPDVGSAFSGIEDRSRIWNVLLGSQGLWSGAFWANLSNRKLEFGLNTT